MKAIDDSDYKDLREICLGSREGPAFYKDDFRFGRAGNAAARILARHGVRARMDGRTGNVTFEKIKEVPDAPSEEAVPPSS